MLLYFPSLLRCYNYFTGVLSRLPQGIPIILQSLSGPGTTEHPGAHGRADSHCLRLPWRVSSHQVRQKKVRSHSEREDMLQVCLGPHPYLILSAAFHPTPTWMAVNKPPPSCSLPSPLILLISLHVLTHPSSFFIC